MFMRPLRLSLFVALRGNCDGDFMQVLACMIYELLAVLALCLFSDCVASKTSSLQSCSLRMKMLMKNWLEKLQAPREAEQKNEGDTVSGRNIRERYLSSKIEVVNCVPQVSMS